MNLWFCKHKTTFYYINWTFWTKVYKGKTTVYIVKSKVYLVTVQKYRAWKFFAWPVCKGQLIPLSASRVAIHALANILLNLWEVRSSFKIMRKILWSLVVVKWKTHVLFFSIHNHWEIACALPPKNVLWQTFQNDSDCKIWAVSFT